ncbi:hypothetical protein BDK51DRAFT_39116 [Blyttiomyces helicus]|uniref:Uncharacterized protein n=1 Tax=Blyttiomyces helicus TaxID=388810 RepID=A0A4P9WFB4_9FUNG|nr:hypothetical protein BDK51DRAFT_39116 [Blyttiomyces helicus]|eukprot:RKO90433.1 hypothetical protein BDK51DRAFT_39116 [Blyttiomyces helicus]
MQDVACTVRQAHRSSARRDSCGKQRRGGNGAGRTRPAVPRSGQSVGSALCSRFCGKGSGANSQNTSRQYHSTLEGLHSSQRREVVVAVGLPTPNASLFRAADNHDLQSNVRQSATIDQIAKPPVEAVVIPQHVRAQTESLATPVQLRFSSSATPAALCSRGRESRRADAEFPRLFASLRGRDPMKPKGVLASGVWRGRQSSPMHLLATLAAALTLGASATSAAPTPAGSAAAGHSVHFENLFIIVGAGSANASAFTSNGTNIIVSLGVNGPFSCSAVARYVPRFIPHGDAHSPRLLPPLFPSFLPDPSFIEYNFGVTYTSLIPTRIRINSVTPSGTVSLPAGSSASLDSHYGIFPIARGHNRWSDSEVPSASFTGPLAAEPFELTSTFRHDFTGSWSAQCTADGSVIFGVKHIPTIGNGGSLTLNNVVVGFEKGFAAAGPLHGIGINSDKFRPPTSFKLFNSLIRPAVNYILGILCPTPKLTHEIEIAPESSSSATCSPLPPPRPPLPFTYLPHSPPASSPLELSIAGHWKISFTSLPTTWCGIRFNRTSSRRARLLPPRTLLCFHSKFHDVGGWERQKSGDGSGDSPPEMPLIY